MRRGTLGRPGLAAVTFSDHGGGIAAVSRLMRAVLREATGRPVPAFTLSSDPVSFETGTVARVAFGARLAMAQLTGRCDWLMFTHLSLAVAQMRVPGRLRRPYAVFLHDIEAWTPLSPSRRRVLSGAFVRLANSRYTAERVMAANPECGRVDVCPLALPPENAAPAVEPAPTPSRTVVIVGRMAASERYKGHDQLIDAWPMVVAAVPGARLVCVGEGDDVPRLREKAASRGLADSVEFPGFVGRAAKQAIYRDAALLAMPSRREGFGLVYLEAMAARLPCIGSVHDAAAEVIVDGETGYLVPQDDLTGLAQRITQLLEDEARRRRMGEAGRQRYVRMYSYEAFRDRVVAQVGSALPEHVRRATETTTAGMV